MTHVTQEEYPSPNMREPKTHQRGKKEISKKPEPLHSEEEDDQLSLLQRGKGNIYFPNSAPSFESSPELRLSLQDASQVKKATLGGTHDLQREQRRISGLQNRIKLFDRKVIHL